MVHIVKAGAVAVVVLLYATMPLRSGSAAAAEGPDHSEATPHKAIVFDDLEDPQWGNIWSTLEYSNADPELYLVHEPVHAGKGAGKLDIKPGGRVRIMIRTPGLSGARNADHPNWSYYDGRAPYPMPGKPKAVGLWVYGKKAGQQIRVNIADRSGKDAWRTYDLGKVDFEGWKLLRADITGGRKVLPPAYPWFLGAFEISGPPKQAPEGAPTDLYLDDVTIWTETDDAFAMRAERFSGGLCDKACVENQPFEVRVWADNLTDKAIELPVEYVVSQQKPRKEEAGRTFPKGTLKVPLKPGEHGDARFTLTLPAGVYNLDLSATLGDARKTFSLSAIAVFPEKGLDPSVPPPVDFAAKLQGHDMYWITSALSPASLIWTQRGGLCFFDGLSAWGLGGPTHLALPTAAGVKVIKSAEPIPAAEMSEPWALVWFNGAEGWKNLTEKSQDDWRGKNNMSCDAPWLIVFQRKPAGLKLPDRRGGLAVTFPKEAGYAVMAPYFGAQVPLAEKTAAWTNGLPKDVVEKCRAVAAANHHFPVETTESFAVDFDSDKVHVRERIRYVSFEDEWGSPARKYAPLPPLMGLTVRAKCPFLSFAPAPPEDLLVNSSVGPYYGIPDVDEYTWTLSGLLKYVCAVDTPRKVHLENPAAKEAYDAVTKGLKGGANLDWYVSGNMNKWAPNTGAALGFLQSPLKDDVLGYLRWASLQCVVPNNLYLSWNGKTIQASDGLAGYDLIYFNPSDYGVFAAYALGSRDIETVKNRWRYHNALLTNFRGAPWDTLGWPGGLAGEGFFDFVISAINCAQLSHMAGDGVGHRYGIFMAARALLAYYAVGVGANEYVKSMSPWPMMDMRIKQDPQTGKFYNGPGKALDKGMMSYENWVKPVCDWEDFTFTDSWGGNLGLGPWATIVRPGEAYHEGIGRFWRDRMGEYLKYWNDGRYRKFMPEWYDAVVVQKVPPDPAFKDRRTDQPVWFERKKDDGMQELGDNRFMNLRLRRLAFGESAEDLAKMNKAMQATKCGSAWAVLEAGTDWELVPLTPMPNKVDGKLAYELGNAREGGSGGSTRTLWWTMGKAWPVRAYYGYYPPKIVAGYGDQTYGVLPATGEVRTDERDMVVEKKGEGLTWNAQYIGFKLETCTDEDLAKATVLRGRLGILGGSVQDGYKGDVEGCVKAHEEGVNASWMVAGPFLTESAGSGFEKDYGPEGKIDPNAQYKDDKGNEVKWRALKMSNYAFDFAKDLSKEPNCLAYAATNIHAPQDMEAYFATGSDDGIRIWLNGELVLSQRVWRGVKLDEDWTKVKLKQGSNRVLVKNDNGSGGWGFAFRVADAKYKLPIPGVRMDAK
jgi:hypothetical protein